MDDEQDLVIEATLEILGGTSLNQRE